MDDNPSQIGVQALPPLARLRFRLRAIDPIRLPDYPGSAWRGLLGHGLRRAACVTRAPHCGGCLLLHHCAYASLFETHAPPGADTKRFAAPPRPYVLDLEPAAPRELQPGGSLHLGLAVIGGAIQQIPYLIHAMRHAGTRGLGKERGRFELEILNQETSPGSGDWLPVYSEGQGAYDPLEPSPPVVPPPPPDAASLTLSTPLRIKRRGHFLGAGELTAPDFLFNLCSRLRLLSQHHGGDPPSGPP